MMDGEARRDPWPVQGLSVRFGGAGRRRQVVLGSAAVALLGRAVGGLGVAVAAAVLRELSLALVGDLRHEARFAVVSVLDALEAAVGQLHEVGALGVVALEGCLLAVVVAGGRVVDGPVEVIAGMRTRGESRDGGGEAQQDEEELWTRKSRDNFVVRVVVVVVPVCSGGGTREGVGAVGV